MDLTSTHSCSQQYTCALRVSLCHVMWLREREHAQGVRLVQHVHAGDNEARKARHTSREISCYDVADAIDETPTLVLTGAHFHGGTLIANKNKNKLNPVASYHARCPLSVAQHRALRKQTSELECEARICGPPDSLLRDTIACRSFAALLAPKTNTHTPHISTGPLTVGSRLGVFLLTGASYSILSACPRSSRFQRRPERAARFQALKSSPSRSYMLELLSVQLLAFFTCSYTTLVSSARFQSASTPRACFPHPARPGRHSSARCRVRPCARGLVFSLCRARARSEHPAYAR